MQSGFETFVRSAATQEAAGSRGSTDPPQGGGQFLPDPRIGLRLGQADELPAHRIEARRILLEHRDHGQALRHQPFPEATHQDLDGPGIRERHEGTRRGRNELSASQFVLSGDEPKRILGVQPGHAKQKWLEVRSDLSLALRRRSLDSLLGLLVLGNPAWQAVLFRTLSEETDTGR